MLLDTWRAGDTNAGQELIRRHFDSVYGFFYTKCPGQADDLVQATFLACVQSRDKFRGDSSFRTFLFSIARHQLYDALTAAHRAATKLDFAVSSIVELVSTPGTKLARLEEQRAVVLALQQLPVEQQVLLELHYWQELEIAQLAEVFDLNAAALRQRLHRARTALQEVLVRQLPAQRVEITERLDCWVKDQAPR
ncbi:MAG: sigma-70 family RNA polymerase sigma factor [bacterium]